ncbi:Calcium/calmodulin-dependent protein kinase type I [Yarrowia sp. B02]|nr:Calcium/calmodulin-dependent protein kinase type I [Yarrowia sp. B02]
MSQTPLPCRYKTAKTLGQGTYSVVKEAMHIETGQYYAAKVINKKLMSGREHMVRNEIVVLKRVSQGHKNILTLVDYFETTNNLYLVTDLARGGELFERICSKGAYYESDAVEIVKNTLSGVAYLHSHGIVHRDLKPENLLFRTAAEDSDLLIADFGLSRIIDEERFRTLKTTCGTPGYMAPEIFTKAGHGKPVDMWALGVITYFLLCGYTPFDRDSSAEEMQAILAGDYAFEPEEYWQDVSEEARDFIRKCLCVDSEQRITADAAQEHPFLTRDPSKIAENETNLLPHVKSNISLRRLTGAMSGTSLSEQNKAISRLKESESMDGAYCFSPENNKPGATPTGSAGVKSQRAELAELGLKPLTKMQ